VEEHANFVENGFSTSDFPVFFPDISELMP
jgi:hypothetical protein